MSYSRFFKSKLETAKNVSAWAGMLGLYAGLTYLGEQDRKHRTRDLLVANPGKVVEQRWRPFGSYGYYELKAVVPPENKKTSAPERAAKLK